MKSITYSLNIIIKVALVNASIILLIEIISGLFPVIIAYLNKSMIDHLTSSNFNDSFTPLFKIIVAIGIVMIVSEIFRGISSYNNTLLVQKIALALEMRLIDRITNIKGMRQFEDPELHNRLQFSEEISRTAPSRIWSSLIDIVKNTIAISTLLISMWGISRSGASIILISLIPHVILGFYMSRRQHHFEYNQSGIFREIYYTKQLLSNAVYIKELRIFNAASAFVDRFISARKAANSEEGRYNLFEVSRTMILSVLTSFLVVLALYTLIMQAKQNSFSAGSLVFFISAIPALQSGLIAVALSIAQLLQANIEINAYNSTLNELRDDISNGEIEAGELSTLLEFKDVWFKYKDGDWILKGVSFKIEKYSSNYVVGLSGAGKSTIIKLICRFYDVSEGEIFWNGINIKNYDVDTYRRHISAIFQDFNIYEISLLENIALGSDVGSADEHRVKSILSSLSLDHMISNLPDGLNTYLFDRMDTARRGRSLSGGERQRIALARSNYKAASLVIMDEPTAHLDTLNERKLFMSTQDKNSKSTYIIVTHHVNHIAHADQILIINNGVIAESGKHTSLLEIEGLYYQLLNHSLA